MASQSRMNRRRRLLMTETSEVIQTEPFATSSTISEAVMGSQPDANGTDHQTSMLDRFAADCGIESGFEVRINITGHGELSRVHLLAPYAFIGRDEDAGIRLTGDEITRHHVYLQAVAGQFLIIDLGSRTGLIHNGHQVSTALLSSGDTIQIGPYTLQVLASLPVNRARAPATRYRSGSIALEFLTQTRPVPPWTVKSPITLLGSAKPSRIRLEHSSVSPQHCAVIRGEKRWWAVDLNSDSGTLVDGTRVKFAPLSIGSELQVGRYQISIIKPPAAEPVVKTPVIDDSEERLATLNLAPLDMSSFLPVTPTAQVPSQDSASDGQGANERLVIELFKEFAALHERTINQVQQSFKEMLQVVAQQRPALDYTAPQAAQPAGEPSAHIAPRHPTASHVRPENVRSDAFHDEEPQSEEEVVTLTDLIQSSDPEERVAAQELLADRMRSLEAKLSSERDSITRRLLRSLSLTR